MITEEHTISILVNNRPGVLSRVAGVFSSRGYNIKTLCVAETTDPSVSRITLTSLADSDFTEKIKKQLDKLIDVIEVHDLTGAAFIHRELMLIRVKVSHDQLKDLLRVAEFCNCRVISKQRDELILEVTGDKDEAAATLSYLEQFGVLEMNRTGYIALARQAREGA